MTRLFTSGARRGQGLIEFAVILPMFLILVGGVCDFGIYMFQREQAASCVRDVARKASVRVATAASPSGAPQCLTASTKPGGVSLTPNYMTLGSGSSVTAGINYTYDPIFIDLVIPMGGWSPIGTLPITANVTMRMEAAKAS
jgi:Flp pilus assembly protein TadG